MDSSKTVGEIQQILTEVGAVVKDFLLENGGLSNGYETYVSGKICKNVFSSLEWYTPNCRDLTLGKIQDKGAELYHKLYEIIIAHGLQEVTISMYHIEDGCFGTTVSYSETIRAV